MKPARIVERVVDAVAALAIGNGLGNAFFDTGTEVPGEYYGAVTIAGLSWFALKWLYGRAVTP